MKRLIVWILVLVGFQVKGQEIVKVNLGPNINTSYNEAKPIISPDGKVLFFARQYYPDNFSGEKDAQDIYFSTSTDDNWSKSENIGFPLNDRFPNGVNSVSPDGNILLIINAYEPNGTISPGVSISQKSGTSWGYPTKLEIENFYNDNDFVDYYISNNGNHMLMKEKSRSNRVLGRCHRLQKRFQVFVVEDIAALYVHKLISGKLSMRQQVVVCIRWNQKGVLRKTQ